MIGTVVGLEALSDVITRLAVAGPEGPTGLKPTPMLQELPGVQLAPGAVAVVQREQGRVVAGERDLVDRGAEPVAEDVDVGLLAAEEPRLGVELDRVGVHGKGPGLGGRGQRDGRGSEPVIGLQRCGQRPNGGREDLSIDRAGVAVVEGRVRAVVVEQRELRRIRAAERERLHGHRDALVVREREVLLERRLVAVDRPPVVRRGGRIERRVRGRRRERAHREHEYEKAGSLQSHVLLIGVRRGELEAALARRRRLPESNRRKRLCRPLRNHSAKAPRGGKRSGVGR